MSALPLDQILVIAGPTGSGKSAYALELASRLPRPAEILCADSITIYKGFDIGSAKASPAERAAVPHHLLDLVDGNDPFTAADFVEAAVPLIADILARGKIPLLVGGTGFYLRALLQGMTDQSEEESARSADEKLALEEECKRVGIDALYSEMIRLDPQLLGKIHPNDQYRVLRALQAMRSTGQRWSELNEAAKSRAPRYTHVRFFCYDLDREVLRERVRIRTALMLSSGLLEEVRALLNSGVLESAKPMQSIGYKEVCAFLRGELSLTELPAAIELATMKLAKAQRTWFRGERGVEWVSTLTEIEAKLSL